MLYSVELVGHCVCKGNKKLRLCKLYPNTEPKAGLEPATYSLRMSCSTNWAISAIPLPYRAPLNATNFTSSDCKGSKKKENTNHHTTPQGGHIVFTVNIRNNISLQNTLGVSSSPQKKKLPNERKLLFHRCVLCIPYFTGLLLHNSFWWASSCTSTAIDAAICVYYIDVAFANCAYRAFVLAGTASDTFVCDKMSHNLVLSNTFVRFFLSFCIPFSEVRTAKIITNSE